MNGPFDDRLPAELHEVERTLRHSRTEMSALELDALKRRVMTRQQRSPSTPRKALLMRSRFLTLGVSALLVAGSTAGGIAASGGASNSSSANSQYHGVGNTHQCPPNSPRGKAGQPGPPCGNANGNPGTNNTGHH